MASIDVETIKVVGETALVIGAVVVGAWRTARGTGKVLDRVNAMWGEMHPNGGSSMRDAINRADEQSREAAELGRETALKLAAHVERCSHG